MSGAGPESPAGSEYMRVPNAPETTRSPSARTASAMDVRMTFLLESMGGSSGRALKKRSRLDELDRGPAREDQAPSVVPAAREVVPAGGKARRELGDVGPAHGHAGLGLRVGEHRDGRT